MRATGLWALLLCLTSSSGCAAPGVSRELLVAEEDLRTVLLPESFGWASSISSSEELPGAIAVGGAASGRVLLYLEFPPLAQARRLLRAELLLMTGGTPGDSVAVELSRSEAPARPLQAWSDQPRPLYPRLSSRLASESLPARLDVTQVVRARSRADEPVRVLMLVEPGLAAPVLVRTGAAGGLGPRLEAYWD